MFINSSHSSPRDMGIYRFVNLFVAVVISAIVLSSVSEVKGVLMATPRDQMNLTIEMGRDSTLTCTVLNIGKRRVIWRKLSEPYPLAVGTSVFYPGRKYRVKRNGNNWQLTIKNVKHADAGEYECRVTGRNSMSEVLSIIITGNSNTHLLPTATTVYTPMGGTAVLPCHVQNRHKSLVLWQNKQGEVISLRKKSHSGDKRHKVLHSRRVEWNLRIRKVTPDDLGVYTCVVNTNPYLTRTVTLKEGKGDKPGYDKFPETGQSTSGRPQLVMDTFRSQVEVHQYESVTLACQFTGNPRPNIKWERRLWTRDGIRNVEDLKTQGSTYTLTNAQPEDTGIYVCKASNGVPPPENGSIRLKVKEVKTTTTQEPTTTTFDPVADAPPRAYALEEVVHQSYGRDTEVACKGIGVPRPQIHWTFNGNRILDSSKYAVDLRPYRHHTMHSTLLVRSLHPGNYGKYECHAFNKYGTDRTAVVLAELR